MAIVFDSDAGTITGLSVGGLPDGIVDNDMLAGSISDSKITGLSSSKLTGALPAISGASLTNVPSNFTLLSTTTCSNTNNIDITLNTSYTENILRFSGIVMQNNNDTLRMSMSDDNGSSYDVRGYCQLNRFTYDSGSWTEYSYTAPGAVTFATDLSNAGYKFYDAEIVFGRSVTSTSQKNSARLIGNQEGNNLAMNFATLYWNEAHPDAVIKLRINGNAGGIASGTIKHYGVS